MASLRNLSEFVPTVVDFQGWRVVDIWYVHSESVLNKPYDGINFSALCSGSPKGEANGAIALPLLLTVEN